MTDEEITELVIDEALGVNFRGLGQLLWRMANGG
jgi:hypothetical protein